jgi:glutamate 5-kinase
MKPKGTLMVDAGAIRALSKGNSLLPAGVMGVSGQFGRGEPVEIVGPDGGRLGIGLTRYTSDEARVIKGAKTQDIQTILGHTGRAAMIHRDDMVL